MRRYLEDFDHGCHSTYLLYYHLVLVTKYRQKILSPQMEFIFKDVWSTLVHRLADEREQRQIIEQVIIREIAIGEDHLHILFNFIPSVELSYFIGRYKRLLAARLKDYGVKTNCAKGAVFTPSYCVLSTGGAPVDIIKRYIERQQ